MNGGYLGAMKEMTEKKIGFSDIEKQIIPWRRDHAAWPTVAD